MLQFQNGPPLEATKYAMRLVRTPTGGKLHLVVTCDQLTGCWTHFYSGRTCPCTGPDCEACQQGASSRWHGYLSAFDPDAPEHVLFEVTAAAAEAFAAYRVKVGSLRGCEFVARRVAKRANARVHITMRPADLSKLEIPKAPNVQAILCHIWGIPITETDVILAGDARLHLARTGTGLPVDRGDGNHPAA